MHFETIVASAAIFCLFQGENCFSSEIKVFRFYPENWNNNSITIQPKTPMNLPSGFTICLRVMFWTLNYQTLLESDNLHFRIYTFEQSWNLEFEIDEFIT